LRKILSDAVGIDPPLIRYLVRKDHIPDAGIDSPHIHSILAFFEVGEVFDGEK
jgi:hypothetical protein